MRKLILFILLLSGLSAFAQTNVTPQFKKNGNMDSLGYSISGISGIKWLMTTDKQRLTYLSITAFIDSMNAHKLYFTNNFKKYGVDTLDLANSIHISDTAFLGKGIIAKHGNIILGDYSSTSGYHFETDFKHGSDSIGGIFGLSTTNGGGAVMAVSDQHNTKSVGVFKNLNHPTFTINSTQHNIPVIDNYVGLTYDTTTYTLTAIGGGGGIDSLNNGVTKTGSIGQLGGTLLQNTNINVGTYNISMGGNDGGDVSSIFNVNGYGFNIGNTNSVTNDNFYIHTGSLTDANILLTYASTNGVGFKWAIGTPGTGVTDAQDNVGLIADATIDTAKITLNAKAYPTVEWVNRRIHTGGITALTGDVTASGTGSVAATLATVNSNVGSFTNASITANAKGLVTAVSSGTGPSTLTFGTHLQGTDASYNTTAAKTISTDATASATASTLVSRDASSNTTINNLIQNYTTTATAAGTTTLTVSSSAIQYFTGSTTQTVVMPVTSTLVLGQRYQVVNNSSGTVTVQSSGGNTISTLTTGQSATFTVILTSGTTAASWDSSYTRVNGVLTLGRGLTGTSYTPSGNTTSTLDTSQNYTWLKVQTVNKNNLITTPLDAFIAQNTTASTSGVPNQYSPSIDMIAHVWNVSGTPADNYAQGRMYMSTGSGASPQSILNIDVSRQASSTPVWRNAIQILTTGASVQEIDMQGTVQATGQVIATGGVLASNSNNALTQSGIGAAISAHNFVTQPSTAAVVGAQNQWAPGYTWMGRMWNTSGTPAENYGQWIAYVSTTSGASPTSLWRLAQSQNTTGTPSYSDRLTIDGVSGAVTIPNGNLTLGTAGNALLITEGTNGRVGQVALVSGTKAITISGVTTSSRAFVTLVSPSGVTLTTAYQAVCTSNTLTIQANVSAGTINVSDGSTLNYFIIN